MRKFAVFDIDGTVYRKSLFIDLMHELYREGFIAKEKASIYYDHLRRWEMREPEQSYVTHVNEALKHINAMIQTISPREIEYISRTVVQKNAKQTYNIH